MGRNSDSWRELWKATKKMRGKAKKKNSNFEKIEAYLMFHKDGDGSRENSVRIFTENIDNIYGRVNVDENGKEYGVRWDIVLDKDGTWYVS